MPADFDHASVVAIRLSFVIGIISHVLLFRRGEWDLQASAICGFWFVTYLILILLFSRISANEDLISFFHSSFAALKVSVAYLSGLGMSIALYRLYFHRLCQFPGPFGASVTGWYHTFLYAKKIHLYAEIDRLHQKYGTIVRIAPSALSITDRDAIPLIYAGNSLCGKGPFYDMTLPRTPINFERIKSVHAQRRRDWDHAFSAKALKSYEPMITVYVTKLLAHLNANEGKPVNIANNVNLSMFELSARLAFDKTFKPGDEENKQFFIKMIHDASAVLGFFAFTPWAAHLVRAIPGLTKATKRFANYADELITERRKKTPILPDIFSWMLDRYESADTKTSTMEQKLNADAVTVTLAGTDTTTAALVATIYYIAQSSGTLAKLQKELVNMRYNVEKPDHYQLTGAKYLNACINEALRMSPPVPSIGYFRHTPPGGLQLGKTFIPGNVTVTIPQYTMNHDSRFWELPNEFIPERWTDRPDLVKDGSVFIPFQIGPYACVGKNLALMEVRQYIASIVSTYDITTAPGQTWEKFYESQKNTMAMTYDDVEIVFTKKRSNA